LKILSHDFEFELMKNPFKITITNCPAEFIGEISRLQGNTKLEKKYTEMESQIKLPKGSRDKDYGGRRQQHVLNFYNSLSNEEFPKLRQLALKLTCSIGSTYLSECVFQKMKSQLYRRFLSESQLENVIKSMTTNFEPDFDHLARSRQRVTFYAADSKGQISFKRFTSHLNFSNLIWANLNAIFFVCFCS
jgi:hypothetical protein